MRILSTAAATMLAATLLVLPVGPAQAADAAAALAPKCKGREVTILGTDDGETLRGTNKRDVILALDGDDRIDGRGGNDVICGGAGRDLITLCGACERRARRLEREAGRLPGREELVALDPEAPLYDETRIAALRSRYSRPLRRKDVRP